MAIETKCSGCGRQLRVADEFAGRQARCPACNSVYTVPSANDPTLSSTQTDDPVQIVDEGSSTWQMKTPEGQTYGPVDKTELDRWVADGRVTADCELRSGENSDWRSADQLYSSLRTDSFSPAVNIGNDASPINATYSTAGAATRNPFAERTQTASTNPYAASAVSSTAIGFHKPHRGGLILALGIIGFLFGPCFGVIFSIIAWVMGTTDLKEIRAGQMDASGLGLTQAGQILGMINSIFCIIGVVIGLFVILMMAAAG